ncbi:MAG: MBL fold metallo-hydrolase [Steroidobacteraceae bacterium]
MKLTFLGAAGTVTGSKYLLAVGERQVLVDCGLFQGLKRLRERNWQALPFDPKRIDAIVLTHAHIDHSGYLPVVVRSGFRGPVYCTAATRRLLALMLTDSAHLQEEQAEFANRHHFSKHSPALPLYTRADAEAALRLLRPVEWSRACAVAPGFSAQFSPAGHLLGAASVLLETRAGRVLFSGDLGRPDDLIMRPPASAPGADWVLIESTYGDRRHPRFDPYAELAAVINRTVQRKGVVVIPSFAVGRAQTLLYLIAELKARATIPDVPVYLNSPMACDVSGIYQEFANEHRLGGAQYCVFSKAARFVSSVEESKQLNTRQEPMIIISASGMATGGRVLHHLQTFAPGERNTIVFSGFQAAGTRGAAMVGGAEAVKIHGEWVPVRAEVVQLQSLSGHADCDQLLAWLQGSPSRPERVFVTHGEPAAAEALRSQIRRHYCPEVSVAEQAETVARESHALALAQ